MTDDHTPVEFSWKWATSKDKSDPKIRYSFEAVGANAGSASDLWTSEATFGILRSLQSILPHVDLSLFHDLAPQLIKQYQSQASRSWNPDSTTTSGSSSSSTSLAIELAGHETMVKAYLLPQRTRSGSDYTCSANIAGLLGPYAKKHDWSSLSDLVNNFDQYSHRLRITPFMMAFDCVPLHQNRAKIYFRSPETSLQSVLKVLRTFDDSFAKGPVLQEFVDLWGLLFGPRHRSQPDLPLQQAEHETAGILYYLEVRPQSDRIVPKVYLPAKHYAASDLKIIEGLTTFFDRHRSKARHFVDNYRSALTEIKKGRRLESKPTFHTYISCAAQHDMLEITSYLSPNVYACLA